MRPRYRMRSRLMFAFAAITLGVASLFGLYAVVLIYVVEDQFFLAQLQDEAMFQQRQHAAAGAWVATRNPHIRLYTAPETFPPAVLAQYRQEPQRVEFSGERGLHYHLYPMTSPDGTAQAWLIAEVSNQLVVRPKRPQLIALLAWSTLAMLALALLVGAWLAKRTSAPLSQLADLVAGMQPNALPERLPARLPDDEIGVLARGLEQLIQRTRAFIAREQAFTRDASHELRTPLAVIRTAGERLAHEPGLSEQARSHLDHIRQSSAQLEHTVAILLALAREQTQPIDSAATPLLPLIERIVIEQSPLIGDRPVVVDVDVPASLTFARPAGVLHILLSNLIGNAFAHTESGEVRITGIDGRLSIANHGHTIDDALRASLHQPFRKREGSSGFGLGLAIVQRLCDRYAIDLLIEHDADATRTVVGISRPQDASPTAANR